MFLRCPTYPKADAALDATQAAAANAEEGEDAASIAALLNKTIPTFGVYVEQEPYMREFVESYLSNFETVLELLSHYSSHHSLDLYLAQHVGEPTNMIRNWAVVLYFQPFASIKLDRMSNVFGWTIEEVEQVVALIQRSIHGRVDSQNKIMYVKQMDYCAELFARIIMASRDIQSTQGPSADAAATSGPDD
ncbi:hypothetical protein B0H11DRAFT_2272668 [Mycena galericulata]|nr:hypothetical protein B0H11DRAFT_2272668 [Mycena galericulata]